MEKLTRDQINRKISSMEGWTLEGDFIVKEFQTKNWKTTIFLVNAIASLAEAHWHHPDLEVSFKKVKVKLTTHEAGGITERDFRLAEDIDRLITDIMKHS
ncbi:MAG: 4a-hydroxytetrahydrobiopterin dehydratase [Aquificota bacterium]|nr:4a-hydroxytetrahydrobiopterin dehydratase [Aquificota bacterium]